MRNKQLLQLGAAAVILLSACNGNKEKTSGTPQSSDRAQKNTPSSNTGSASSKATINVTIAGGDLAGTYSAECKEGCCSWGIAGDKTFGNQYSETDKGPKELSSVQLVVDDVTEGNKTTKEFMLTVSFGKLFSGQEKSFNINTLKGRSEGSGTLDLRYSGNTATVTIKGVSKEGPAIDLTMECHKVINPKNLMEQ